MPIRPIAITVAVVTVALSIGLSTAPAFASPAPEPDLSALVSSPVVAEALADIPDAVLIDSQTVTWDDGTATLTVSPSAVGTCPTGDICAFSATNLSGARVSYATCGTHSVGFAIRSAANARTSGALHVENAAGTVLATVAAGGRLNAAPAGSVTLSC